MRRNLFPVLALAVLLLSVVGVVAFFGVRAWLAPAAGVGGMHPAFSGSAAPDGLPWPVRAAVLIGMLAALLGTVRYGIRKARRPTTNR